jgi:hypothetical protein
VAFSHSPNITTTGLVLAIDAGNVKSYPGTGTTWTDLSTNARALTLTNGPVFSYVGGGSIAFDGTNDVATFTSVGVTNNLTVIAWIRTTSTDSTATSSVPALPVVGDTQGSIWYSFGVHGGKVRYYNAKKNGVWSFYDSTASVNDGNWHHIAVTHSKSGEIVSIYVDGAFDSSYSNDSAGSTNYWASYMNANRIGTSYGSADFFQGSIAQVLIYDALLTAADIKNHYSATRERFNTPSFNAAGAIIYFDVANAACYPGSGTSLTDLSGLGNTGTLVNGPTYNASNGGSIVLDGTNDYIEVTSTTRMDLVSNHSISIWYYQTSSTAGYVALVGKGTSDSDEQYCLLIDSTRTQLYYDVGNASGPYIQPTISTLSLNTWYNIVVTHSRSGSTTTLLSYVNGVKQSSSTLSPSNSVNTNTSNFRIGVARGTNFPLPARVAHCILYNRTLSDLEIMRNFEALRGRFGV